MKAKSEPKLLNHGGNMAEQGDYKQVASKGGMTAPYILARLKRDGYSELAETGQPALRPASRISAPDC